MKISKSPKAKQSDHRYTHAVNRAFRSLIIKADNLVISESKRWDLQKPRFTGILPRTIFCSKTGRRIGTIASEQIAHLQELHGVEGAEHFLEYACVGIAIEWRYETTASLRKLASADPAGFFVFVTSQIIEAGADNSKANAQVVHNNAIEKNLTLHHANENLQNEKTVGLLLECNEYARRMLAMANPNNYIKLLGIPALEELQLSVQSGNLAQIRSQLRAAILKIVQTYLWQNKSNRHNFAKYGITSQTINDVSLSYNGSSRFAKAMYGEATDNSDTYNHLEFMLSEGFDTEFRQMAEELIRPSGKGTIQNKRALAKAAKDALDRKQSNAKKDSATFASFESMFDNAQLKTESGEILDGFGFQISDAYYDEELESAEELLAKSAVKSVKSNPFMSQAQKTEAAQSISILAKLINLKNS